MTRMFVFKKEAIEDLAQGSGNSFADWYMCRDSPYDNSLLQNVDYSTDLWKCIFIWRSNEVSVP